MSYPEQIRKQIEEAAEIEKRFMGGQETPTAEPEGTQDDTAPAPEGMTPTEPQAAEPETPQEVNPLQAEVDALKAEIEKERQRFRTLEGKYKAEPAQMRDEIAQLRAQIAELSKPKEEKKPEAKSIPQAIAEMTETYGDNFVDALRQLTREEFSHLLPDAVKPLEEKVGGFERAQVQTAQERFVSSLVEAHPDLPTLNYDDGFIGWLQSNRVPFSDISLADALSSAEATHNAARAIEIINAYKESAGLIRQPEPEKTPVPKPDVAPPKSRAAAPPNTASTEKKIWTQSEISSLHRALSQGTITRDEYNRQWADVGKAMVEGRIR